MGDESKHSDLWGTESLQPGGGGGGTERENLGEK